LFIEEYQILKKREEIAQEEGETTIEVTPLDVRSGVYPKSYFDLEKYPTHWKIVNI